MDDDDAGAKYAYLLQPIKDLDKNFAIDIVGLLETYQQQLAQLAEDVEYQRDNAHRFNFAEAAMLIQGSVSVFGKKVDHVYTQAMNFFDTLKTAKEKKKKKGDNAADDEGFGGEDDENADPLGLVPVDPCQLQDMSRVKPANLSTLVLKHRGADIPSISIMPMSLMPLADFEKCNVPIYNSKNKSEIVGKKDDFKINTGYMGSRGALLLDLLNERLVDKFVKEDVHHSEKDKTQMTSVDSGRGSPAGMDYADADLAADISIPLPGDGGAPGGVPRVSHVIEMNRRATGGLALDAFPNRPSTVLLQAGPILSQPILEVAESMYGGDENEFFDDEPLPVKREPWQADPSGVEMDVTANMVEDPFEVVQWKHKPLNPIKCHVDPLATVKRREKEAQYLGQREKVMEMIDYVNENYYYQGKRQRTKKQLGISWEKSWDTDALFPFIMKQQKQREKLKREQQAKRRAEAAAAVVPAAQFDDDDDYGNGGFDDDDLMDGQPLRPSQPQRRFADIDDEEMNITINVPSLYVGKHPNADEPMDEDAPIDLERPNTAMSLADLLDFYMKRYWTEAAEATSKLAARVQEWDEKMQPLLEEEETRKEFDIHEYGGELLEFFQQDKEEKALPELLKHKKDYEISRYFLSCLMMANTMNVEIVNEQQTGPDPLKMMRVKLLKRDRHHEVFNQEGAL